MLVSSVLLIVVAVHEYALAQKLGIFAVVLRATFEVFAIHRVNASIQHRLLVQKKKELMIRKKSTTPQKMRWKRKWTWTKKRKEKEKKQKRKKQKKEKEKKK